VSLFGTIIGGCANQGLNAAKPGAVDSERALASPSGTTPLTVEELAKLAGQPCETPLEGSRCMSDESDFELSPDCSVRANYATVRNPKGTVMLSRVPPQNNVVRSTISFGQLLCVQAIARIKNYPSYAFVTAIPSVRPSDCLSCAGFGTRKIVWQVPHKEQSCKEVAPGRFEGGCAIGWVDADDLELLENAK
jgi:hypothetical protein